MINENLVKVSGKSLMHLKTLYIYIHGLTDRIINTATKPQKLFYLRVLLSTCFSAIFSFLTYSKKSLILFYVLVTEYMSLKTTAVTSPYPDPFQKYLLQEERTYRVMKC